jgi:hypothetical protein
MDLSKALRELYEEKKRLDRVIEALEASQKVLAGKKLKRTPRGRKSMGPEERLAVSRRMSAYWAARRAQQRKMQAAEPPSGSILAQNAAIA